MNKYDMEHAIKKLEAGETIVSVCRFYEINIDDLDRYIQSKGFSGIRKYLKVRKSNENKKKSKVRDQRMVTAARMYIKKGKSFEEFLKDLKASERPYSEEQLAMARRIFSDNNIASKDKTDNNEIEI